VRAGPVDEVRHGNMSLRRGGHDVEDAQPPDRASGPAVIGVAMSIPPPFDAALNDARLRSGDPLAELIPAHITLLGPTEVDPARFDDVQAHLATIAAAHRPYSIHLRGTGTFRPLTEVVFVAVATGIGECELLAADVRTGPLARDLNYPYHPHVTVAHDVPPDALDRVYAEMADFEAAFDVDHFTFYVHGSDGRWRPVRDFPLGVAAHRSAHAGR
jgi:2'-5' RNA ligase